MKTQRAARGKRAGGDNKPMLRFLGGRNMVISSSYCLLAGVHRNHVEGRSRTVANRTAFAKLRIGVDVGVCHARNVEMASRASRGGSSGRAQEAGWINDGVLPHREHVMCHTGGSSAVLPAGSMTGFSPTGSTSWEPPVWHMLQLAVSPTEPFS